MLSMVSIDESVVPEEEEEEDDADDDEVEDKVLLLVTVIGVSCSVAVMVVGVGKSRPAISSSMPGKKEEGRGGRFCNVVIVRLVPMSSKLVGESSVDVV